MVLLHSQYRAYTPQPNCTSNADANTGHAFGILMACIGTLRTFGAPAPLTSGVRHMNQRTTRIFVAAILFPPALSLGVMISYHTRERIFNTATMAAQMPGIFLMLAMLIIPGSLLYTASFLSRRNWFSEICCGVTVLSAFVYGVLLTIKDAGMGLPAVCALEAWLGFCALIIGGGLRAFATPPTPPASETPKVKGGL